MNVEPGVQVWHESKAHWQALGQEARAAKEANRTKTFEEVKADLFKKETK